MNEKPEVKDAYEVTHSREEARRRALSTPPKRQEGMTKEKAKRRQKDCYEATAEALAAVDEAIGQVTRGETAN